MSVRTVTGPSRARAGRGPRHAGRVVLAVAVVVLVAAACQPANPPASPTTPPASPLPPQCNPLTVHTCGLPFPSDQWTRPDATTATGLRVDVPDDLVSASVLAEFQGAITPAQVYGNADGFSAAGPILFEVDHAAAASLPRDGAEQVVVFDTDTGERIPIDARVDQEAAHRGAPGTVITVWPRARFPWGHHIVAAVTTDLVPASGGAPFTPAPALAKRIADNSDPNIAFLDAHGVKKQRVVAVTGFTVRSEENATGLMDSLTATTQAQAHPVRGLHALPNFLGIAGVGTIVTGQVQITDFRDAKTGAFTDDRSSTGRPSWIDFTLTLPASVPATGAPVAIYGHGIGIFKESMIVVAGLNAQRGVATIAIDQPNHGSRIAADGGFIFDLFKPQDIARVVSIIPESSVDLASLLTAVRTSLRDLDAAPFNLFDPLHADGRPDLDTSRVLYEGTSLGGVLGTTFVAEHPELDGALLQITGVGIMHNLSEGTFWYWGISASQVGARGIIPKSATAGEAALLVNAAQHLLDRGDAINLADRLADTNMPIFIPYAVDDGAVPNATTDALAELAGLPLITPAIIPRPQLASVPDLPADGRALVQAPTDDIAWMKATPLDGLRGVLAHVEGITNSRSGALTARWLDQTLAASAP